MIPALNPLSYPLNETGRPLLGPAYLVIGSVPREIGELRKEIHIVLDRCKIPITDHVAALGLTGRALIDAKSTGSRTGFAVLSPKLFQFLSVGFPGNPSIVVIGVALEGV